MISSMDGMYEWASKLKQFILPVSKVKDVFAIIRSVGGEVTHYWTHIVDRHIPCECTTAELSTSSFHIRRRNSGATGFFVTETNYRCNIAYCVYIGFCIKDDSDIDKLYQFIETLKTVKGVRNEQ